MYHSYQVGHIHIYTEISEYLIHICSGCAYSIYTDVSICIYTGIYLHSCAMYRQERLKAVKIHWLTSILRLVAGMLFLGVARGYSSLLKSYI